MAVVKMKKFTAIGIDAVKEELMKKLMDLGVAELSCQDGKLGAGEWAAVARIEKRDDEVHRLDKKLSAADSVLKSLGAYDHRKKPLFRARTEITETAFMLGLEDRDVDKGDAARITELLENLKAVKAEKNKYESMLVSLRPWAGYELPLESRETGYAVISLGIAPGGTDLDRVRKAIEEVTDLCELDLVKAETEHVYVSLICHKEADEQVWEAMKPFGFGRVAFNDMEGTVSENAERIRAEIELADERIAKAVKDLEEMTACIESLELYYDSLAIEKGRAEAHENILVTDRAFYVDGWVPADGAEGLGALLEGYGCHYETRDPEEGEEAPVLLKNNRFVTPVEIVTGLYSLPKYNEPDPTPVFALFYICFFGIMFADMGYGAILALAGFFLARSGKLEGNTKKFITQLGYCGVSTFIWGIVFGSFFGDLVTVINASFFGRAAGIAPLWFNPVENIMTMLIFSCAFGVAHIFVALGMRAYVYIKSGRALKAVNDAFLWYALIIGLLLLAAGEMAFAGASSIGLYMTVISAVCIVALPLFYAKGVDRFLGIGKLYSIVSFLADVLSYARLLALCLAGTIIAQVFNMLAGMNVNGAVGMIGFVVILIIAHLFNFLMSGLSSFVHSIRLQYVEFFGKFFEGNGEPFEPFMRKTKYVNIVKEGS